MKKFKFVLYLFLGLIAAFIVFLIIYFNVEYKLQYSLKDYKEADVSVTRDVSFDGKIYISNDYYYQNDLENNKIIIVNYDNQYTYNISDSYYLSQPYYYSKLYLYEQYILFTISRNNEAKIISFDTSSHIFEEYLTYSNEIDGNFSTFVNPDNRLFQYETCDNSFYVWELDFETKSLNRIYEQVYNIYDTGNYKNIELLNVDSDNNIYTKDEGFDTQLNNLNLNDYVYHFSSDFSMGFSRTEFYIRKNKGKELVDYLKIHIDSNLSLFFRPVIDYNNRNIYYIMQNSNNGYLLVVNLDSFEITYKKLGKMEYLSAFVNGDKLYIGKNNSFICVEF